MAVCVPEDGCETVGKGMDACLYLGDGLLRGLAAAVQVVPQLRLAYAGDALQAGQADGSFLPPPLRG